MLRKLLKYIVVAASPLLVGCNEDFSIEESNSNGVLSISLRSNRSTRADSDSNDSQYNEDKIENVVFAFYPNEYGDETEALAVFKPGEFTLTGTNAVCTAEINLSPDLVNSLFEDTNGNSCKFFAIANLTTAEINAITGSPTITELKNLNVSSEFTSKKQQDSFVMRGTGTVTYYKNSEQDKTASGSGTLSRSAAKISLSISIETSVSDSEGKTWTPVTSSGNLRVLLNEGVNSSTLISDGVQDNNTYYSTRLSQSSVVRIMNNSGSGVYTVDVPLYTYPNVWDNTKIDEEHRTTMTLVMTWQQGTSTFRTFYYQVPVTPNEELVSNHSYQVNLHVGMLGSLTPDTPLELDDVSYQIVDWGSANVNVNISETRYLIVNPNYYEINNEGVFRIPFYSSHDVIVSDISMEYNWFSFVSQTGQADTGVVIPITANKTQIDNSVSGTEKMVTYTIERDEITNQAYLRIDHPLLMWNPYKNNTAVTMTGYSTEDAALTALNGFTRFVKTNESAFMPFIFNVKLEHADNSKYTGSVEITQYPGMYIKAIKNPGGDYYESRTGSKVAHGYAYVNPTTGTYNNRTYYSNDTSLGGLLAFSSSSNNKNPNMYQINITNLSESSDYIIGDPRTQYYTNDLSTTGTLANPTSNGAVAGTWCQSQNALYPQNSTTKRRLSYYYPTNESDAFMNMVAPSFHVASCYGEMSAVGRPYARRRCATYQERSYAGGRWRMPTYAELKYIVYLGENGMIPRLLEKGGRYWTAHGLYTIQNDGSLIKSTSTTGFVRCVYDDWYWDVYPQYTLEPNADGSFVFTFGDMPRQ